MKQLYLIRHGETAANKDDAFRQLDTPLCDRGREQAREARACFAELELDAVFSSPLPRSLETAEIVFPGREITADDLLVNLDLGDWAGQPKAQVRESQPELWRLWVEHPEQLQIPGGGTLGQVFQRSVAFLGQIERSTLSDVAAVTHRSVIKALLAAAVGLDDRYYWKFHMDNCSVSLLRYEAGRGWAIAALNRVDHLSGFVVELV
jgi:broad specificity phosphatase PhoE